MGGGGGHSSCNASLSQPNVQKNNRVLVRGWGGLKFEKKCSKTIKPTVKEKLGIYRSPCILYFFIHPNPLQRGSILETGALFLISLSLVEGGGHNYYLLAL